MPAGLDDDPFVARAFWIRSPGVGEIRTETLPPELPTGHVRVRTLYTAVSRGTESRVFRGEVPPSEYERMRAPHQLGDFPGPVKYGYINVGEVEAGPPGWAGRRVFCLYPHQTRYRVPAADVRPLPASLPTGRAVLAANMETAVNALWDLQPLVGDRIAVVGGGVVGLLVGWLASRVAAVVELVDVDPSRASIAAALGLRFATPSTASGDVDRVVHASGHPDGLVTALRLAGPEATVLELSWYGDRRVALPLGEAFHARRLTIRSSQVGTIAPAQAPRWSPARRMALAFDLLGDDRLDALVTGESPFDELPAVLARLAGAPSATLCHRIRYAPENTACTPSRSATT